MTLREALSEVARLRLATGEGTCAQRFDRAWGVATAALQLDTALSRTSEASGGGPSPDDPLQDPPPISTWREIEPVLVGYENMGPEGDYPAAVAHLCRLLRGLA